MYDDETEFERFTNNSINHKTIRLHFRCTIYNAMEENDVECLDLII